MDGLVLSASPSQDYMTNPVPSIQIDHFELRPPDSIGIVKAWNAFELGGIPASGYKKTHRKPNPLVTGPCCKKIHHTCPYSHRRECSRSWEWSSMPGKMQTTIRMCGWLKNSWKNLKRVHNLLHLSCFHGYSHQSQHNTGSISQLNSFRSNTSLAGPFRCPHPSRNELVGPRRKKLRSWSPIEPIPGTAPVVAGWSVGKTNPQNDLTYTIYQQFKSSFWKTMAQTITCLYILVEVRLKLNKQ